MSNKKAAVLGCNTIFVRVNILQGKNRVKIIHNN